MDLTPPNPPLTLGGGRKRWVLFPAKTDQARMFAQELSILETTAQILINRGIQNVSEARAFLDPRLNDLPDPLDLPEMKEGVERLAHALLAREPIAVYGDYDADGISSTALLCHFFREVGVTPLTLIPDRMGEGYGVHAAGLERLRAQGARVVVTVDCGTKSHEALRKAKDMGLDVIVADHHALDEEPPPAFAFINPQNRANGWGRELSGVGVAFFLLLALRRSLRENGFFKGDEPNLKRHLDLVALGTIADLVPLTGINRILVRHGLIELKTTRKVGLQALKEVCKLDSKRDLKCADVAFRLAPRINAGGRIAQAALGLNLLCENDPEKGMKLARLLDQCNRDRQTLQEKQVEEALDQVAQEPPSDAIVVANPSWHPGIVGLVAAKLVENFYRPAIALTLANGVAKGSARSIPGIHIVSLLEKTKGLLTQFGGHAAAAGLSLPEGNLSLFRERLSALVRGIASPEDFVPLLEADAELELGQIGERLMEELERLKPFGLKNPEPLFVAKGLHFSNASVVGKNHLRLRVADRNKTALEAIGFNLSGHHPLPQKGGDIAFSPQWNDYLNSRRLQLKLKDIKFS